MKIKTWNNQQQNKTYKYRLKSDVSRSNGARNGKASGNSIAMGTTAKNWKNTIEKNSSKTNHLVKKNLNGKSESNSHLLSHSYTFYYLDRLKLQSVSYKVALTKLVTFSTIEEFWSIYSYLVGIENLTKFEYLLFRDDIKPMWEDISNKNGGKWQLRFSKNFANRLWENCILSWIGGKLDNKNEITGMVISTNNDNECIFSVWNKNSSPQSRPKIKFVIFLCLNQTFCFFCHLLCLFLFLLNIVIYLQKLQENNKDCSFAFGFLKLD